MKKTAAYTQIYMVVATKGLDISRPTTVDMPNNIHFARLYSHEIESVAKELSNSNKQDSICDSAEGNWGENLH